MVCTVISIWGAQDLDKFVAFVGCFAWSVVFLYQIPVTQLLRAFVKCPLVLRLSCDVALQGVCEDQETKVGGHCDDRVWHFVRNLYFDSNYQGDILGYLSSCTELTFLAYS
jgi:hypothetical protein